MIKYNWDYIQKVCNYDTVSILQYFCFKEKVWLPNYLPKNYDSKVYHYAKYSLYPEGDSFILNIVPLLKNEEGYFLDDLYTYIKLASWRSYFEYKVRNETGLPAYYAKASRTDFKQNPILEEKDGYIQFKYEQI